MKTDKNQTPGKTYQIKIISKRDGSVLDTLVCGYNADNPLAEDIVIASYCTAHKIRRQDILLDHKYDEENLVYPTEYVISGEKSFYSTLYIDTKRTIIKDRELGVETELSGLIENIDKICINGIMFVKEKK